MQGCPRGKPGPGVGTAATIDGLTCWKCPSQPVGRRMGAAVDYSTHKYLAKLLKGQVGPRGAEQCGGQRAEPDLGVRLSRAPVLVTARMWTMHLCPCSCPPCDPAPSSSLGWGVRRAPGQPPGEEPPWLVELAAGSWKARQEVGEGCKSWAWHTLGFRSRSCCHHLEPSPHSLAIGASTPAPPEVSCWSRRTWKRGCETFPR